MIEGDTVREPDPAAQHIAGGDEFGRQVDAGDAAAVAAGDETRAAAEAAADIQHLLLGAQGQLGQQILARLPAADMEFVDRTEVVDGDAVRGLAERRGAGLDRGQ